MYFSGLGFKNPCDHEKTMFTGNLLKKIEVNPDNAVENTRIEHVTKLLQISVLPSITKPEKIQFCN